MKVLYAIILLIMMPLESKCQRLLSEYQLKLSPHLKGETNPIEISGIASFSGGILLIPTFKGRHKDKNIYSIDSAEISKSIRDPRHILNHRYLPIDSSSYSKIFDGLEGHDGIEGAVVSPNRKNIYFLVETNNSQPHCYVVKGKIQSSHIFIEKKTKITKPKYETFRKGRNDSGFESIGYLSSQNCLVAIFEFGDAKSKRFAGTYIDLNLSKSEYSADIYLSYQNMKENSRLTDIYSISDSTFIGILSEFSDSVKNTSQLVLINMKSGNVTPFYPGYYSCLGAGCNAHNWEGVSAFKKGFIMVTDNRFGNGPVEATKLSFFRIPDR